MKRALPMDKKRELRATDHLTVPPRLEGKVKNAMMNPVRKPGRALRMKKRSSSA